MGFLSLIRIEGDGVALCGRRENEERFFYSLDGFECGPIPVEEFPAMKYDSSRSSDFALTSEMVINAALMGGYLAKRSRLRSHH